MRGTTAGLRTLQRVFCDVCGLWHAWQVLWACVVKIRVKPPRDAKQLYEVEDAQSVVRGSRKLAHSDQMR